MSQLASMSVMSDLYEEGTEILSIDSDFCETKLTVRRVKPLEEFEFPSIGRQKRI